MSNAAAVEHEKKKTAQERAEDIAYTINHSIACTVTDFINPVVNAYTEGKIKGIGGCGHDHSGEHVHTQACHHGPAPQGGWQKLSHAFKHGFNKERLVRWAKGEFIGDFGAVPLTIAMQRYFPGGMDKIRRAIEPVMGPVFRFGVERSARKWAKKEGVDTQSQDYKDHVDMVYEHEMGHLPQAVAWTGFSLALNVGYQMLTDKSARTHVMQSLLHKTAACLAGMGITAGLVVGARAIAPEKVREFDTMTSEKLLLPVTKTVGRVFGVDEAAVDRMAEKQEQLRNPDWVAKARGDAAPLRLR